jgi:formylglycine-generating enzyme required for sulfatase activity
MDMAGNAWEWCQDWVKSYPGNSNPVDDTNRSRVLRGGGWSYGWYSVYYYGRCAYRSSYYGPDYYSDIIGFRLAR